MSEKKTVLVSLNERNRVVEFSGSLMSDFVCTVKDAFADVLKKPAHIVLQIKDENWGGVFIDVQSMEAIKDRSILRVIVEERNNEEVNPSLPLNM